LILARDRLGVKPLYFAHVGNRLAYASETKAILRVPFVPRDLNHEALAAFMNYSTVPGPAPASRRSVRVMPGHVATSTGTGFTSRSYWDLDFFESAIVAPRRARGRTRAALADAIA
jgi:asparagine synthase (glutamine-hydrolysing)